MCPCAHTLPCTDNILNNILILMEDSLLEIIMSGYKDYSEIIICDIYSTADDFPLALAYSV